ncbi:PREDICTED: uncharacterized protein LOC108619294 [Drosophila arizonae]|uniref:Uncharacterized protein LOC108619294 n=1 Tax=Drosophila arizonae TaxID=7263 RepID=A0ABM1PVR4_DROAR|nr:PREDICTED: uncharacterized protein LOC108619294 [Drosophila arizonae]
MTFRDFPIKSLARFIMMGEGKGTAGKCSCCSMNGANFWAINSKTRNFPLQTKLTFNWRMTICVLGLPECRSVSWLPARDCCLRTCGGFSANPRGLAGLAVRRRYRISLSNGALLNLNESRARRFPANSP